MARLLLPRARVLLLALALCAPSPAPAQPVEDSVLDLIASMKPDEPLKVRVGVDIRQITSVDQKAENFGVVARIRLSWQDPALAFEPDSAGADFRSMSSDALIAHARGNGLLIPNFTVENQQTRSFIKESVVVWSADGSAFSATEMIVTLQAPDFDFVQFPFDTQQFFVRLAANLPADFVTFEPDPAFSGMGDQLGEEEWRVLEVWTETDTVTGLTGATTSRYSLGFSADRHLLYYTARVFVPMLLLICVSWANLFLEEYRRRIDIAGANLLAFIAFSFAISGDLPRLGYLTFLDSLLMAMFVLSAATVVYNVMLRRLAVEDRLETAKRIDWHVTIWFYPLLYLLTVVVLRQVFFF